MLSARTTITLHFKSVLLHCLVPLVIGVGLYALFRPSAIGLPVLFTPLPASNIIAYLLSYHAPDGLWAYSFASALFLLYQASFGYVPLHYRIAVLLLLCFFEGAQLWLPHRFTFDVWDLVATGTCWLLAVVATKNLK